MSQLVLASPLKADVRLAQAISEFERDLTAEQKAAFRAERLRANSSQPTVQDVTRLTAEINTKIIKGTRCFGTRFLSVLHAVQKFASIGDVVVGGSQNLIACGVWSVVRIALLAIPNAASVMERISEIFMYIGRTAPQHERLALLYYHSPDLQNLLSEYYIILVSFCQKIVKLSKKSTVGQLFSPISETDLTKYQNSLKSIASSIRDEIQVLIAHKVESDSASILKLKDLSTYFSQKEARKKQLRKRDRVLAACSEHDYEVAWKQLRKLGRATIHEDQISYTTWRDDIKASALVINGKLGSGKSVLMANIVDDLIALTRPNTIVTYFFCRWDTAESLSARTIFGSLLRQIINSLPESENLDKAFDEVLDRLKARAETDDLIAFLYRIIPKDLSVYFVLDNVGECPGDELLQIGQTLVDMLSKINLKLCISQRTEADSVLKSIDALELAIPVEGNRDIEQFIGNELERSIENKSLSLGNPKLVLEIHQALQEGADGMMLWVSLQIQALCQNKTDAAIRKALKNLPRSLSETFTRILSKSGDVEDAQYRQKLFILVMASIRPLNTAELCEALSVEPGNIRWDPTKMINNIQSILNGCGGLLVTDEEDQTVRFVHQSFKQYLTTESGNTYGKLAVHRAMADIVVTYLNYQKFERQIARTDAKLNVQDLPSSVVQAVLPASTGRTLALRLLRQKRAGKIDISKTIAEINAESAALSSFHAYAKENLRYHAWCYILLDPPHIYHDLLLKILPYISTIYWDQPIYFARQNYWDSDEGLRFLLDILGYLDPRSFRDITRPRMGLDLLQSNDLAGDSPWDWALKLGCVDLLERLIPKDDSGEELVERSEFYLTLLSKAFQHGHLELATIMLERSTGSLDVSLAESDQETILQTVVIHEYPDSLTSIDLLLQHGSDPTASPFLSSSFYLAVSLQRWDVAQRFLDAGADIDHRGRRMLEGFCSFPIRPIQLAWLVQHGANVMGSPTSSFTSEKETILDYAARQLDADEDFILPFVKILLSSGISADHELWAVSEYKVQPDQLAAEITFRHWREWPPESREDAANLTSQLYKFGDAMKNLKARAEAAGWKKDGRRSLFSSLKP